MSEFDHISEKADKLIWDLIHAAAFVAINGSDVAIAKRQAASAKLKQYVADLEHGKRAKFPHGPEIAFGAGSGHKRAEIPLDLAAITVYNCE